MPAFSLRSCCNHYGRFPLHTPRAYHLRLPPALTADNTELPPPHGPQFRRFHTQVLHILIQHSRSLSHAPANQHSLREVPDLRINIYGRMTKTRHTRTHLGGEEEGLCLCQLGIQGILLRSNSNAGQ